ncbi:unnamed protein product, partial [Prunus brigantina]
KSCFATVFWESQSFWRKPCLGFDLWTFTFLIMNDSKPIWLKKSFNWASFITTNIVFLGTNQSFGLFYSGSIWLMSSMVFYDPLVKLGMRNIFVPI